MRTRRCRTRRRWREIGVVAGLATVSLLPPVSARASGVAATPAPKPPASGVHETTPLSGASDPNTGQVTVQEHTCKPKGPNTRAAMGKAVNACNPDTDWQTEVTVTWTQTGVVNGKPVGTAKQTRTQRPGPGEVTTAAAPAPETQTLKGAPPPSGGAQQSADGSVSSAAMPDPYYWDGQTSGGCCSDAGIKQIRWNVTNWSRGGVSYYAEYQHELIESYWWGGGIAGQQWGVVIPWPSAPFTWVPMVHHYIDGSPAEKDYGYATGPPQYCCDYFYYNWALRRPSWKQLDHQFGRGRGGRLSCWSPSLPSVWCCSPARGSV
jgi:hypothetical protein